MSAVEGSQRSKRYRGKKRRQSMKKRLDLKNESLQLQLRQAAADKEARQVIISDLKRSVSSCECVCVCVCVPACVCVCPCVSTTPDFTLVCFRIYTYVHIYSEPVPST